MPTFHVLVVAQQTAAAADLLTALQERAARSPSAFTLLMPHPPTTPRVRAESALEEALGLMRGAGLRADGMAGFGQPLEVVQEAWDPRRWDEVIVSTLPGPMSTWMRIDLPHHVQRFTGVQVTHVVAQPRARPLEGAPRPPHAQPGVLSPLAVLSWGGARR